MSSRVEEQYKICCWKLGKYIEKKKRNNISLISEEILRIEADHRRMQYVDLDQTEPVPATTTSEIIIDIPLFRIF